MSRGNHDHQNKAGAFFMATLVMWAVSVFFEIFFNKRTELVWVLSGFCFFQSANWVVRNWVSRDPLFVNTCVSLLHSSITSASDYEPGQHLRRLMEKTLMIGWPVVCGLSANLVSLFVVLILVNQWRTNGSYEIFEHSQLFGGTWPWAYQALCFSCGYFAYDQWDMLRYRLYSGWIPAILLHHLILLVCVTLALYRNVTINYLILTLICELHSIFLHVRKVRRMAGIRDAKSRIVKAEWVLNWVTFTLARFTSHVLITAKLIKDAPKFGKGVELPLALFGMAGMNFLNVFLGIDLFNAYRRESNPQKNSHKQVE